MLDWLSSYWDLLAANPAEYLAFGFICFALGFSLCRLLNESRIETLSERLRLREDEKSLLVARVAELAGRPTEEYTQLIRRSAEERIIYLESRAAENLVEGLANQLLRTTIKRNEGVNIDWRLVRSAKWLANANGEYMMYGPNEAFVACRITKSAKSLEDGIFPAHMPGGPLLLTVSPPGKGLLRDVDGVRFGFEAFDSTSPEDQIEIRSLGLFRYPAAELEQHGKKLELLRGKEEQASDNS